MNRTTTSFIAHASPVVPREVVDSIARSRRPVIIAHVVPDADAMGSMLATALAWTGEGRTPRIALPDGSLSQKLGFLRELAKPEVATAADFASADAFVVLDTASKDRCNVGAALKETDWSSDRPVVNVDHHATNTRFGGVNWIVPEASSACELVYEVLRSAERRITPTIASLLYAGIQTDTLGFSLASSTPTALRAAADLVELGADVADLGERLGRSQRQSEFDLLRVIYANTKVVGDGRIAYSSASFDEIHNAGCTAADIDDQITVPRSLDGVQLAMLFSEGRKGRTRINFRGSGKVTVVELAQEFNGGGHAQAAGAILDCSLEEAIRKLVPRAIEHIKRFS
ncbi:MAG: DHH family phosphoesterase [Planctomycetota bacterium]